MKNYLYFVILLFLFPLSSVFAERPVRIGILTDLSGPASYWGVQTRVGVDIAAEELEAEGNSVEIIFEDHGLSPKNAVSSAQKLLFADKVDAIYSEYTVTTIAVSPVVKNAKKLFLGDCAANSFLERNPYAFKSYIDYVRGCEAVALYWRKNGIKKAAILKAETEYGELCAEGLKKVYPESSVVDYKYGQEVHTQALLLKKSGADAVLNASFEGDILNMMEAFSTLSYEPYVAANFDAITERVRKTYSRQSSKLLSFGFQTVSDAFIAKVLQRDSSNSLVAVEGAALGYLHIKQMVKALRSCEKDDVMCQVEQFSSSGPDPENVIGFERFSDRQAVFSLGLKHFPKGNPEWIEGSQYN